MTQLDKFIGWMSIEPSNGASKLIKRIRSTWGIIGSVCGSRRRWLILTKNGIDKSHWEVTARYLKPGQHGIQEIERPNSVISGSAFDTCSGKH